jgi:putative Mg2+ transporter-C (MgtC) family protein
MFMEFKEVLIYWLVNDWHELMPSTWAHIVLTLMSVLCGSMVGFERERKQKSAGLRTMTLICLGSTIFTFASLLLPGPTGDEGRVAAQIVNGIGFLGAGAILRGLYGVRGMTTAATIWSVAAVGMIIGIGYAGAALGIAVTIVLVLVSARIMDDHYLGTCKFTKLFIAYDPQNGKTAIKLDGLLDDYQVRASVRKLTPISKDMVQLQCEYCHVHRHHKELLSQLVDIPEVKDIRKKTAFVTG